MAMRLSTGFRNKWLGATSGAGSYQTLFTNCFLRLYSGSQPASADAAETGTLLITFVDLNWDDAASGVISKAAAETWTANGVADGTAGWGRFYAYGSSGGASTTEIRWDFACGTSGTILIMSSTTIAIGAPETIDTFTFTVPASI